MDMTRALMLGAGKTIREGRKKFVAPYAFKKTFFVTGKEGELDAILSAYDGSSDVLLKTHAAPSAKIANAIAAGDLKATLTFRDPRDAVVSILEVAARDRERDRDRGFTHIETTEQAVTSVRGHLKIVNEWRALDGGLQLYYPEFTNAPLALAKQLTAYLELDLPERKIRRIANRMTPQKGHEYNIGESGRWRHALSEQEMKIVIDAFGEEENYFSPASSA